ncbi:MAG: hypothetical protein SGJ19_11200 [Planctomycetia bacterium]|nr:hypothetical protein [Planctomycetia bacterium]
MLTDDEAITVGLRKYRELFPQGVIPPDLEERGVLSAIPEDHATFVQLTFGIRGQRDPFYLFKAAVDRASGDVTVLIASDWKKLLDMEFDESDFLCP